MVDEAQRIRIWERDEGTCQVCRGPGEEIDHIEPKRMGGRHGPAKIISESDDNLQLICMVCHYQKHSGGRLIR